MSKWEDKYLKLKNGEFDGKIDELKDKLAKKTITREEYKEYEKLLRAKSNLGKVENVLGYKGKLEKDLEDLNRELMFRKNSASASKKLEELDTGLNIINIQISKVEKELKNPEIKEERKEELLAEREKLYKNRDANASEFAKQKEVLAGGLGRESKLKNLSEKELENNMTLLKTRISKCNMVAKNLLNGVSWDSINLKLDNWDKKFTKEKDKGEGQKPDKNEKTENDNPEKEEEQLKKEEFEEKHPRLTKIKKWFKKIFGKEEKMLPEPKPKEVEEPEDKKIEDEDKSFREYIREIAEKGMDRVKQEELKRKLDEMRKANREQEELKRKRDEKRKADRRAKARGFGQANADRSGSRNKSDGEER